MKLFRTKKTTANIEKTIPVIMSEIISICKEDKVLFDNKNLDNIEKEISDIDFKINKQQSLIMQSEELNKDIESKLNLLENEIYSIRTTLLEELGSEI